MNNKLCHAEGVGPEKRDQVGQGGWMGQKRSFLAWRNCAMAPYALLFTYNIKFFEYKMHNFIIFKLHFFQINYFIYFHGLIFYLNLKELTN